jgi:DNA replication protein DnaC
MSEKPITPGRVSAQSDHCEFCFGTGMEQEHFYSVILTQAPVFRARHCRCRLEKQKVKVKVEAIARIPEEFGVPRLADITADPSRHPQQADKIRGIREELEADPYRSFFIFGDNGTGKSFLAWALYVDALEKGRKVVACELEHLLNSYRRYQFRYNESGELVDKSRPLVLAEDLLSATRHWTIFLDEIAATSPTEYAAKEFFYLLKAAHENRHQLIFTCNVSPLKLQNHWSKTDEFWGDSIARRIAEYTQHVNLFRPVRHKQTA